MFLTVHATAGAGLALLTNNPLLAFILGFISHFIIDIIPHGDEHIDRWTTKMSWTKRVAVIALLDFMVTVLLFITILKPTVNINPLVVLAGVFGAILPDFLQATQLYKKNNLYMRWHYFWHVLTGMTIKFKYGLIVQIIFLFLLLYPLLNF